MSNSPSLVLRDGRQMKRKLCIPSLVQIVCSCKNFGFEILSYRVQSIFSELNFIHQEKLCLIFIVSSLLICIKYLKSKLCLLKIYVRPGFIV
eukprot:snap_masked-scaffold_7-processed-gene-4.36-mRNA-1 protein AED:1.00 eAED:1.00 QI:0/0/0/0/1/1/4/0/91